MLRSLIVGLWQCFWRLRRAGPARAQSGYDRPGGDYSHFQVQNGDPAACAARCERDAHCRAWSFSYPDYGAQLGDMLAQARGQAAGQGELLRLGRARRRRDRAARRRRSNIPSIATAATSARSRPSRTRRARSAPTPARPTRAAGPGPIAAPATARRSRAASSRTRSSRRGTGRAASRAWCGDLTKVGI